jgi:hypothetical protein
LISFFNDDYVSVFAPLRDPRWGLKMKEFISQ